MIARDRDAEQAKGRRLANEINRVNGGVVDLRRSRCDAFLREVANGREELLVLGRKGEVHSTVKFRTAAPRTPRES